MALVVFKIPSALIKTILLELPCLAGFSPPNIWILFLNKNPACLFRRGGRRAARHFHPETAPGNQAATWATGLMTSKCSDCSSQPRKQSHTDLKQRGWSRPWFHIHPENGAPSSSPRTVCVALARLVACRSEPGLQIEGCSWVWKLRSHRQLLGWGACSANACPSDLPEGFATGNPPPLVP